MSARKSRKHTTRGQQLSFRYGRLGAKVFRHWFGREDPLPGALVVFRRYPSGKWEDERTTGDSGATETFVVPAGQYQVVASRIRHGPFHGQDFRQTLVREGPVEQVVTVLPDARAPRDAEGRPVATEASLRLTPRSPLIRVEVQDADRGNVPLPSANVEVIGNRKGQSDGNGKFESGPLPLKPGQAGRWVVQVWKDGWVPVSQGGPRFLRQVRITENAFVYLPDDPGVCDWDIELRVRLTRGQQVLPGSSEPPLKIWAAGGATPAGVFFKKATRVQAGWSHATYYNNLAHLADILTGKVRFPGDGEPKSIQPHQIQELAIVAHGDPGVLDVDQHAALPSLGVYPDPARCLTLMNLPRYRSDLERIGRALQQNATVYLMGCRLAHRTTSEDPERLLCELSLIWPTVLVVACRSIVCIKSSIGARETPVLKTDNKEYCDQPGLPWVTTDGQYVTQAQDGNIIQRGAFPRES